MRRVGLSSLWLLAVALGVAPAATHAQGAPPPRTVTWEPARDARFWVGSAALLAIAIPTDASLRDWAAAHRGSRSLDRVASAVDPLGRAHDIVPALALAVVAPRVVGRREWSDAALRVALSYFAADAVESVLKPSIGRHRPSDGRGPLRFAPFSATDEWHSFPSGHVAHAFALATGISAEAHRPWVTAAAFGAAGLVGAQRVYRDAHWGSDVVGGAALTIATSSAVDAMLRRRGLKWLLAPVGRPDGAARLDLGPTGVGVALRF